MNQVDSAVVPKDRKEIYLGEALRRLLLGRREALSTVVNTVADRYQGLIDRQRIFACTVMEEDIYREVIGQTRGRLLESREVATFPQAVADYIAMHPGLPRSAYDRVQHASFAEILALIDRLERDA